VQASKKRKREAEDAEKQAKKKKIKQVRIFIAYFSRSIHTVFSG